MYCEVEDNRGFKSKGEEIRRKDEAGKRKADSGNYYYFCASPITFLYIQKRKIEEKANRRRKWEIKRKENSIN